MDNSQLEAVTCAQVRSFEPFHELLILCLIAQTLYQPQHWMFYITSTCTEGDVKHPVLQLVMGLAMRLYCADIMLTALRGLVMLASSYPILPNVLLGYNHREVMHMLALHFDVELVIADLVLTLDLYKHLIHLTWDHMHLPNISPSTS